MFAKEQESKAFDGIIKPYKLLEPCTIQQFLMKLRQNKAVTVTSIAQAGGCGCGCGGTVHQTPEHRMDADCTISGGSYFIEAVYGDQKVEIHFSETDTVTLFTDDPNLELAKLVR